MPKTLTARLHQKDGETAIRLFELYDDRFLRVRQQSSKRAEIEYAMDVAILDPQASEQHFRPRHWFIATAVTAGLLLIYGAALYFTVSRDNALILVPLFLVLCALPFLFIWLYRTQSRHLLVFNSRYAQVPLVELLVRQPNAETYGDFVRHLNRCIATLVQDKGLTAHDLRAGEMRSLRKMVEQGAIDNETYEQAKARLLALSV